MRFIMKQKETGTYDLSYAVVVGRNYLAGRVYRFACNPKAWRGKSLDMDIPASEGIFYSRALAGQVVSRAAHIAIRNRKPS